MIGLAFNDDFAPGDSNDAIDHADGPPQCLEHRSLFDVQFQIAAGMGPIAGRPGEADSLQFVAEADAIAIAAIPDPIGSELARDSAGRGHRWFEAHALFVGPVDQTDRARGFNIGILQGRQNFESGEHT